MIGLMNSLYLYLKAIHIIAAFAWMAGMFYLPRLYVYHAQVGPNAPQAGTFKIMERRLLTVIMNPAMIVTVALGLWLAFGADAVDPRAGWLHAKIALVVRDAGASCAAGQVAQGFRGGRHPAQRAFLPHYQ